MKITIISHVQHIANQNEYYGYAPYIREMNIWFKYVDDVIVVAPIIDGKLNPIYAKYEHKNLFFSSVPEFNITSVKNLFYFIFILPKVAITVFKAMSKADHIHLRCPGNMGLIASFVQILFPKKKKTAKYAGNWDPKAKQPLTYKLQRWILSNSFLTKNMQVLVYGNWPNQSKNIKPFFTATYFDSDKVEILPRTLKDSIEFLFVGTLSKGKKPLYAIELAHELAKKGYTTQLNLYGEGEMRVELETYIKSHKLENYIFLKGNQSKETVLEAYKKSHFLLLPSKSEGWPKVVAEAMFWGCIPVVTPISCVPDMLNYGTRGVLLNENLQEDVGQLTNVIHDFEIYNTMSSEGQLWSQKYTLDYFENEIKKLLET